VKVRSMALLCGLLTSLATFAVQPQPQAPILGGEILTPIGAQRAGNAQGTIPPWTGGLTQPPANYRPEHHEVDPFPEDQILFTIDADNMAAYADQLSPGQQALLKRYPQTWHLNVYRSRRSAAYPQRVYDAIARNATSAQLVTAGRGGVTGAEISSPFPLPTSGVELIWNHNLRWRGIRVERREGSAAVTRAGRFTPVISDQDWAFPYGFDSGSPFKQRYPNLLLAIKSKVIAPGFLSGDGLLVFETIDQTNDPRKTWNYSRALRRVVRLPYFGYQIPAQNSDGLRTVDDFDLYNGPPDRFEWRLLGKRELYIPYNAYRLHDHQLSAEDIIRVGHINPDHARYELHRVWEVEGRIRSGERHVYSRRVFYLDEDSWQIAVADSYDNSGELWRVNEAHALNYYTVPVLWSTLEVYHDLKQERMLVNGLDNEQQPYRFRSDGDPREFSPNALIYYLR
jgi:hypothetical protein